MIKRGKRNLPKYGRIFTYAPIHASKKYIIISIKYSYIVLLKYFPNLAFLARVVGYFALKTKNVYLRLGQVCEEKFVKYFRCGRVKHSRSEIPILPTPGLLCHKNTAQVAQSPIRGHFLSFAVSLWHSWKESSLIP